MRAGRVQRCARINRIKDLAPNATNGALAALAAETRYAALGPSSLWAEIERPPPS